MIVATQKTRCKGKGKSRTAGIMKAGMERRDGGLQVHGWNTDGTMTRRCGQDHRSDPWTRKSHELDAVVFGWSDCDVVEAVDEARCDVLRLKPISR